VAFCFIHACAKACRRPTGECNKSEMVHLSAKPREKYYANEPLVLLGFLLSGYRPAPHKSLSNIQVNMTLATVVRSNLTRSTVRQFSARAPEPTTRTQQAVTTSLIASAVLLPFIPPALESRRERLLGHPNARKHQTPLCFHCN
jgi:hypothetical protein